MSIAVRSALFRARSSAPMYGSRKCLAVHFGLRFDGGRPRVRPEAHAERERGGERERERARANGFCTALRPAEEEVRRVWLATIRSRSPVAPSHSVFSVACIECWWNHTGRALLGCLVGACVDGRAE